MPNAIVGQKATAHVRFTRPDGSEGEVDPTNPPTWEAGDGTVLSMTNVALDSDNKGSNCDVVTVGAGVSGFICKPDVDLDPGAQNFIAISSTEDVAVAARPVPLVNGGNMSLTPFVDI